MKATVEVQKAIDDDTRIGFFLIVNGESLVAGMLYLGESAPPTAFSAFDSITPIMTAVPETSGTQLSIMRVTAMPDAPK